MKTILAILAVVLTTSVVRAQTNTSPYDWKDHLRRIDALFLKHIPEILKGEREHVESILSKDKSDQYMKEFENGMQSETGIVMIEREENRWLEIAYREGYARKVLFRQGYFTGLAREAESDQIENTSNHGLESTSAPPAAGTLETHP